MSQPKHLAAKQHRGLRILLLILLALGLLFLGLRSFLRAPELPPDSLPAAQNEAFAQESSDKEAEKQASEEAARKEAARKAHLKRKPDCYTILLSGLDDHHGGADTNILVSLNVGEGFLHAVSIPRDTKAVLEGKNRKINYAYNQGGMEQLSAVISEQLGIPVDYTITIDLRGFIALVDAIGGVDFFIPLDMDYDDPEQDLAIHFEKGPHHLSGEEAMQVVRFRHNNDGTGYGSEDLGRMQTQQNFLKAVAKQLLTAKNLPKIPKFVEIFMKHVEAQGLTNGNLVWLGTELISMGPENLHFSTLPGDWKSPYIYLDKDACLELVNSSLNPYVEDRVMEDLLIPS